MSATGPRHVLFVAMAAWLFIGMAPALRADEIHDAVWLGDLEKVKQLVVRDAMLVRSRNQRQETPLHVAARCAHSQVVTFLLAHGAQVNAKDQDKRTPLHVAGNKEIAKALLASGADLHARNSRDLTPFENAVCDRNRELIDVYVAAGEKLDFMSLVELERTQDVAAMLRKQPWLAKAPRRPLHAAVQRGNYELVKLLLDSGADPNLNTEYDSGFGWLYTPLSVAVNDNRYEIAELLCQRGADANVVAYAGKWTTGLLHYVADSSDSRFVKLLLEYGADVHAYDTSSVEPMTPLHVASCAGNLDHARLLLEYGAEIDAETADGTTPLFFAAVEGHDELCSLLVSKGARLDFYSACALGKPAKVKAMLQADPSLAKAKDRRLHRTALHWAAKYGHRAVVQLLLANGAHVNAVAPEYDSSPPRVWPDDDADPSLGETPLHVAATAGQVDIARLLLDRGAHVNAKDQDGDTPLHQAVKEKRRAVAQLLLERGADVDTRNHEEWTALDNWNGDLEITRLMLARAPKRNTINVALSRAAKWRHKDVAQLLLARGAEPDLFTACILGLNDRVAALVKADPALIKTRQSHYPWQLPLTLAAQNGHTDVVALLLTNGAEIEPKGRQDTLPLVAAAENGHRQVVELLISKGAEINQTRGRFSECALLRAASAGHDDLVCLLLAKGAPLLTTSDFGRTALHKAASDGHPQVLKTLLAAGMPVDLRDCYGRTALHDAASGGHTQAAAVLLDSGADVNARNVRGQTPLARTEDNDEYSAEEIDYQPVARLLRSRGGLK